jgi:tRNA(adenine34) deaminase
VDLQGWMRRALAEAALAAESGEVPVGAVLVWQNQIIAADHNHTEHSEKPLEHAEMRVLAAATGRLSQAQWRESTLFVSLEPCPMCMGALMHCHLGRVVFAASNLKWGACGSVCDFLNLFPAEQIEVLGGICEAEAQAQLADFFKTLRASRV